MESTSSKAATAPGPQNHPGVSPTAAEAEPRVTFRQRLRRWHSHRMVRLLMLAHNVALAAAKRLGPKLRQPRAGQGFEILLTGRFESENWAAAHLRPLALSKHCERLTVVSTYPVPPIPKVETIYPPRWLNRLIGATSSRLLVFTWIALRRWPHVVGGFHIKANALLAAITAPLIGARSLYFCVGGVTEIVHGGTGGEGGVFSAMETADPVVERRLLRAVRSISLVITMGSGAADYFRQQECTNMIRVVSGGIEPHGYPAKCSQKPFEIVFVGRLAPIKCVDLLLRAVAGVVAELPEVTAAIVGDGPLRGRLEGLATDLGIGDRIKFIGFQKEVWPWLGQSRVFVLTSRSEGLSLAMMEAMMCGLPAIVPNVGDLNNLVEHGVNGYLVDSREPEAFARQILDLLGNPARYEMFSEAARQAARRYETAATTASWDGILVELRGTPAERSMAVATAPGADGEGADRKRNLSRKDLWGRLPRAVKAPLGWFLGVIPQQHLLGARFRRTASFVRQAQWWSSEQLRDYQLKVLRQICTLAYEKTEYYRRLFDAVGFRPEDLKSLDMMSVLPTMDKTTVRQHWKEMLAKSVDDSGVDYCSTGGSNGTPLAFYMGKERSGTEYAYLTASWARLGYQLGMPMAVLRGRVVRSDRKGLYHEHDPLLQHHYYSNFHMTDENMGRYLEHIATLGPCFLHVYPSSVAALACFILRSGGRVPENIRGIIAESETIYPEQRKMVEEVFGCRYFSCYGHSEKLVLAAECEFSSDYHVWPTYGYFELLDDQGNPVTTPGQRGEIVGTGFINTVMPFIRYRTGDHATYVGDHCEACGRQHTIIRDIRGHRTQEMLVAGDGAEISWAALNMHDDTFARVRQFQFYQDTPGKAVLKVIPADGFGETDCRLIQRSLGRKFDGRLEFTIQPVDQIPLTPRGKTVYVDQRIGRGSADGLKNGE